MDTLLRSLRALGEANRLQIVRALIKGSLSGLELQDRMAMSQPSLSRHIRILREAGLIEEAREGRRMVYRLCEHKLIGFIGENEVSAGSGYQSGSELTINKDTSVDVSETDHDEKPDTFQEWLR